ncbi:MAG: cytochrome c biogenesis protein CcdA [Acetobacteraceae bacterium]|nr:cytochrome c biogenesis protein CcdA [Acetobacteraceae bacterium]
MEGTELGGLVGVLTRVIAEDPWLGPLAALTGGALTALNPCVLATIPLIIGFVGGLGASGGPGQTGPGLWLRPLWLSLLFVAGLSLELAVLFVAASGVAWVVRGAWWVYVVALTCFALGLHLLGVYHLPPAVIPRPASRYAGAAGALLLGFLFGLISLPCTGPVLLFLAALVPALGPTRGGVLLFMYGVGHSLLILAAGTSAGLAAAILRSRRLARATEAMRKAAGIVIILVGAYLLFR